MKSNLRSRWPLLLFMIITALFASYYFYSQCIYPGNKSIYILSYGILCTASILFLTLYVLRKNIYSYAIGSRQGWLQAHIYIGIISIVLIFMHFRLKPTGTFSTFLTLLFFLVIFSGIIGSLIYNHIPLSLTKYGRKIKTEEEINIDIENCMKDAETLVADTSAGFRDVYIKSLQPFFKSKRTKWEYLFMEERALIHKLRNMIENHKGIVAGQDIHDLDLLGSILIKKEKLSFMLTKLRIQRAWLTFHLPLTVALLTAITIHIFSIVYY